MQQTKHDTILAEAVVIRPSGVLYAGFATPVEAAKFLRLSKAMIFKLIGEGRMPASRFGRAVRIPWSWLRTQAGA